MVKLFALMKGIKLVISDGKVIVTILGNVDGITVGIDVGTEFGSLDGSFDGSNYVKLEGLLLGDSLASNDGKMFCSDEGIKQGLSDFKVIGTIHGDGYGITWDILMVTHWHYTWKCRWNHSWD